MQSLLFDIPAFHIPALAGAAGLLGVVALVACLIPSLRAARLSPLEAMNQDGA